MVGDNLCVLNSCLTVLLSVVAASPAEAGTPPLLSGLTSPVLFRGDANTAYRDPAATYHDGVLGLCTYPTPSKGAMYGNEDCRPYIVRGADLVHWGPPELLRVKGPRVAPAAMGRIIDPYLFEDKDEAGKWWCFYKQNGASRFWSRDLKTWTYVGYDKSIGENICIIRDDNN